VLGAREQPLQNLLLFDGEKNVSPIYPLHPIFPLKIEDMAAKVSPTVTTTTLPVLPGASVALKNGVAAP
jgi:ubiquitin-like 1-activating enzyme E1 A